MFPVVKLQINEPLVPDKQYTFLSSEPTTTKPVTGSTTGDAYTILAVVNAHNCAPDPDKKAYTFPSSLPTYTTLLSALKAGVERTLPPVNALQTPPPVLPLIAYSLKSLLPTNSVPSGPTHGEDSYELPAPEKDHDNAPDKALNAYSFASRQDTITVFVVVIAGTLTIEEPSVTDHTVAWDVTSMQLMFFKPVVMYSRLEDDRTGPEATPVWIPNVHDAMTLGPCGPENGEIPEWWVSKPNCPHACMAGDGVGVIDGVDVDVFDDVGVTEPVIVTVEVAVTEPDCEGVTVTVPVRVTLGEGVTLSDAVFV